LAYIGLNKLNTFIRAQKDKLLSLLHSNIKLIVYKINCKNCDASYVGQTGRILKTRIKKHKNHKETLENIRKHHNTR